ncbi:MAG: transglycosylase SLT domain-containing protein [Micropruina sp.]
MPSLIRPVVAVLAALTLAAGTTGSAHANPLPQDPPLPAPSGDGRTDQNSRDLSRPQLSPEVARALTNRQATLAKTQAAIAKTQVAIATQARTLSASEFVKQRAAAEKKLRYADDVKKLGYDIKTTPPRDIAKKIALDEYNWGKDEFNCVNKIFTQESEWKWNATNPTSGAYGIPQSLPANKMASAGDDWKTNPATQIKWGLKYMKERYGTPCKAWAFKRGTGWY